MSGLVVQSERKLLSIPVILSHKGNLKRPLCTLTEATVGLRLNIFLHKKIFHLAVSINLFSFN